MSTAIMSPARFTSPARYSSQASYSSQTRMSATRPISAEPTSPVRPSRLRITRRGYALLTVIVAAPLVVAAFGFAVNGGGAAAGADASSVVFEHVTVQPGESLWQLAGEIAPSSDPRDVVSDIVQLNQLDSADVQPGQSLAVPLKYSH